MSSTWILNRLRESIARLILRQRHEDAAPGSERAQETSSDVTFTEAAYVHSLLSAYADEIETRLAALRVDVALAKLTDEAEKHGGGK